VDYSVSEEKMSSTTSTLHALRESAALGAVLFAFGWGSACGQTPPSKAAVLAPSGSLVVGPSAARDFDLRAGDTLPEVSAQTVPGEVNSAAERQATEYSFAPKCTRYFTASGRYVALLIKSCRAGEVLEDGQGMAVYERSGQAVGRPTPWLSDHYTGLQPTLRPAP